jgi:hypothetical protein
MKASEIKIFLITPKDKVHYKKFIIFTDNEIKARELAATTPSMQKPPGQSTPLIDPETYLDKALSSCEEVRFEIIHIQLSENLVHIKYQNKDYFLTKDHPVHLVGN